jgi:hypothetical protein
VVTRSPWQPRVLLAISLGLLCASLVVVGLLVTMPGFARAAVWVFAAGVLWLGVGVLRMGSVQVDDDAVIVRTEVRSRRISRAAIVGVGLEARQFPYRRVAPVIAVRAGRPCRLGDFSSSLRAHRRSPTTSLAGRTASMLQTALGEPGPPA